VSAPLGEGSVELVVDPGRPGRNDLHAYLLDAGGGPDDSYDDASFALALPALDIGPLEHEPVLAAPGHFQLLGTDLDLPGEWTLTVTVKPDRFTEQIATLRFRIQ
jgi:copper transport protein